MLNKKINVSEEVQEYDVETLNSFYEDIIVEDTGKFSNVESDFYNQEIERIENGIHEQVNDIILSEIEAKVNQFEF